MKLLLTLLLGLARAQEETTFEPTTRAFTVDWDFEEAATAVPTQDPEEVARIIAKELEAENDNTKDGRSANKGKRNFPSRGPPSRGPPVRGPPVRGPPQRGPPAAFGRRFSTAAPTEPPTEQPTTILQTTTFTAEKPQEIKEAGQYQADERLLTSSGLDRSGPRRLGVGGRPILIPGRDFGPMPVEPKPVESKPVESKPIESKPVESKPVESKPVKSKPVSPKPVQSNRVVDRGLQSPNQLMAEKLGLTLGEERRCWICNNARSMNDCLSNGTYNVCRNHEVRLRNLKRPLTRSVVSNRNSLGKWTDQDQLTMQTAKCLYCCYQVSCKKSISLYKNIFYKNFVRKNFLFRQTSQCDKMKGKSGRTCWRCCHNDLCNINDIDPSTY